MPRVYRSEVKVWSQKAPLHSRSVRPHTPQPASLEHDPHPPSVEAAQYHVAHAQ